MYKPREPDWSFIQSDVDLKDVPSLEIKKPIFLINEFIMRTTDSVNTFAMTMESKIFEFESRLSQLETQLDLMDAKLSLCKIKNDESTGQATDVPQIKVDSPSMLTVALDAPMSSSTPIDKNAPEAVPEATPSEPQPASDTMKISEHPTYAKYFKMLKLGIPEAAVRIKMSSEGVDPDILANPNAPVPAVKISQDSSSDSDSDSSFGSSSDD